MLHIESLALLHYLEISWHIRAESSPRARRNELRLREDRQPWDWKIVRWRYFWNSFLCPHNALLISTIVQTLVLARICQQLRDIIWKVLLLYTQYKYESIMIRKYLWRKYFLRGWGGGKLITLLSVSCRIANPRSAITASPYFDTSIFLDFISRWAIGGFP